MSALTVSEKRTLQACEDDIERGAGLMSKALKKIYDEQLFRESDESFADYCQRRWNIKKSRAYQLVGHAGIVAGLIEAGEDSTIVEKITEAATREIADLPTETQAEVVREAAKESGGKAPTAKQTAAAREKVSPKPASPKQQVSDFFEGKESVQEKTEEPPKPKPGKPKNDYAKFGDSLLLHYISPLVRGIDQLAEKLGGKGEWHAKANNALNSLIDAIKQMKGGKK